jgi:DNA-binding transcriptional LysR family regulator
MNLFVSLKYLVALDDHRHFGRAALACHVTQPALSNALRALETHFGTSIVKRGRTFAGFTAEGARVLHSARRMLHEQELLQQDLQSAADTPKGHLMVGAVPTSMPVAARFVALLQARHPGITPTLRSMSSVELEVGLEHQAIDLGLGYAERQSDGGTTLQRLPQYTERYYLLRKAPTRPGKQRHISWAQAAKLPLCLLSAEMHNRTIIDRAFATAGVSVRPAIETNSTVTLTVSVLAGEVCSVLPGALLGMMNDHPQLQALQLIDPPVEVPIAFLVHGSQQPSRTLQAALAFAQTAPWLAHAKRHSG